MTRLLSASESFRVRAASAERSRPSAAFCVRGGTLIRAECGGFSRFFASTGGSACKEDVAAVNSQMPPPFEALGRGSRIET